MPTLTRALAFGLAALSFTGVAHAHPAVDEAQRLFEEAELEQALDALDRAEQADALTEEELASVFETRALVHAALGDTEAAERDLARLVAVAPAHTLSPAAPPQVRARFEALRAWSPARPSVRASATREGERVVVRAEQTGEDPLSLVRRLRVVARAGADGEPQRSEAGELSLEPPLASPIAYFAEALGPGRVVLARDGSEADPLLLELSTASGEGSDEVLFLALGLGAGGAVLAAVVIGVAVALSSSESELTQPSLPDL